MNRILNKDDLRVRGIYVDSENELDRRTRIFAETN